MQTKSLPKPQNKSLLERGFYIRIATQQDKSAISKIWRNDTSFLGGVQFAALNRNITSKTVHVAIADGKVVAFVDYYARLDNWNTIYHIAVDANYRNLGIGAKLLYSVPCPIRLKVTSDNTTAIRFYERHHMDRVSSSTTKTGRELYTYELRHLFIQCAGNNPRYPAMCRSAGIAYGSRHDATIYDYPFMLDINWRDYDWNKYRQIIKRYRPVMAMVADYEDKTQYWQMRKQVHQLKHNGVMRVMVCPKFDGAIDDIPNDCVIAVSVPSSYAGYLPSFARLKDRRVHLLGGSPVRQRDLITKMRGHGAIVISTDGNGHTRTTGMMWKHGKWNKTRNHVPLYQMFETSARNIAKMLNQTAKHKQLQLAI